VRFTCFSDVSLYLLQQFCQPCKENRPAVSFLVSAYFPYCCLLLRASACYCTLLPAYSVLLIVYLNVLDFSFRIKTTTFYFTSKVELVQHLVRAKGLLYVYDFFLYPFLSRVFLIVLRPCEAPAVRRRRAWNGHSGRHFGQVFFRVFSAISKYLKAFLIYNYFRI
jgi:hypothetical protein